MTSPMTHEYLNLLPLNPATEGPHLSGYFPAGSSSEIKKHLRQLIREAECLLRADQTSDFTARFLGPIQNLLHQPRVMSSNTGSFALFRTQQAFRITHLPIEVERTCIISDSFHIKPLIKTLQEEKTFLLLGVNEGGISLYKGSDTSFKLEETIQFPELPFLARPDAIDDWMSSTANTHEKLLCSLVWINAWISRALDSKTRSLFLAGDPYLVETLAQGIEIKPRKIRIIKNTFDLEKAPHLCTEIRAKLEKDAIKKFDSSMEDYEASKELGLTRTNIHEIAKLATKGEIRRLFVAEDFKAFGRLDRRTGAVTLHSQQLNTKDDDLLDDLAELVLSNGGEVFVATCSELPDQRALSAVIKHTPTLAVPIAKSRRHFREAEQEKAPISACF